MRATAPTPTQMRILELIADGKTIEDIAERLRSSPNTVKTHRQRLLKRLGCHSVSHAVAIGFRSGWLR